MEEEEKGNSIDENEFFIAQLVESIVKLYLPKIKN